MSRRREVGHGMIAKPTGSGGPGQGPLGAVTGGAVALDVPEGLFRTLAEATGSTCCAQSRIWRSSS